MAEQGKIEFPFQETLLDNGLFKRIFEENVDSEELIWHRDREDRKVTISESKGWLLQIENKLPIPLEEGKEYFIKANEWHRVIKGKGKMILFIEKGSKKHEKV